MSSSLTQIRVAARSRRLRHITTHTPVSCNQFPPMGLAAERADLGRFNRALVTRGGAAIIREDSGLVSANNVRKVDAPSANQLGDGRALVLVDNKQQIVTFRATPSRVVSPQGEFPAQSANEPVASLPTRLAYPGPVQHRNLKFAWIRRQSSSAQSAQRGPLAASTLQISATRSHWPRNGGGVGRAGDAPSFRIS